MPIILTSIARIWILPPRLIIFMHSHFSCRITICVNIFQQTDKSLCLLSDLMSCFWYSGFLQSDKPPENRKIKHTFQWSSRLVMEIKRLLNLCLLCDCTKTCSTCIQRHPKVSVGLLYFECRNLFTYFLTLKGKPNRDLSSSFTYHIARTLLVVLFHVFRIGHGTFCRPNSFHRSMYLHLSLYQHFVSGYVRLQNWLTLSSVQIIDPGSRNRKCSGHTVAASFDSETDTKRRGFWE